MQPLSQISTSHAELSASDALRHAEFISASRYEILNQVQDDVSNLVATNFS